MPSRSTILTIVVSIFLSIGCIWIGYNINFLPVGASKNAAVYDELFHVLFNIGAVLFVGMTTLVIFSLVKFRRRPGQTGDGLPITENLPLEIFWTAIPTIVVLFVGLYSYDIYDRMGGMQTLHSGAHHQHSMNQEPRIWAGIGSGTTGEKTETDLNAIPIEVSAQQFAFLFHYPKGDILSGELHVPLNKPVSMKMESKDVIHAFWVPEFRIKQDVIPGQPTILNFTPTKAGRYPIICAELCGPYHGGMRSTVVVEKIDDFENWYAQNAKSEVKEA